LENCTSQNQT